MSTDYNFEQSDVVIKFRNIREMKSKIKAFEKKCKEYTDDGIYCPAYISQTEEDKKNLIGKVLLDSSGGADIDELAELITSHFAMSNGCIKYAFADVSASGFIRNCGGGKIEIKDGKII